MIERRVLSGYLIFVMFTFSAFKRIINNVWFIKFKESDLYFRAPGIV